ncbi:phosphoglycerate mutase [Streptomyces sp. WM6373]|uniref:histidine phosphatase family protein n=1 Tax=Streptomyces TaxID=1883 RepID=UPI0006AE11F7|nr:MULTISPECIES: histidine phosphatase family protein [unclassified Streptomyces]KOU38674.1 phosphoglycerate mutase [Streptomyces sp. WM6373]KOU60555.1 phosphoglycerate mutase [Streptomyces sp. IGB124]KOU79173.1 phosphoglycerate mutase [Streptomyces sp. XY66]KOV25610.1 phosphoglycerate mutase [Streptomyces sp. XY413]KOV32556.1 phosphoglycerate mutase [Streptomyces sp. H021]
MPGTAARYLYLTRHGEASSDESELTDAGRRQAALLGQRLRGVPLTAIHHGPLARAEQTARLIGEQLDGVPLHRCEAAGDFVPCLPSREELPPEAADAWTGFLDQFTAEEREQGPGLAAAALAAFTGPVDGDAPRHELVVTHNFLVGWLVRAAFAAPEWRWLGINHANAALTVIRYTPDRPPAVLVFNDTGHLPAELRWTGFPQELHV